MDLGNVGTHDTKSTQGDSDTSNDMSYKIVCAIAWKGYKAGKGAGKKGPDGSGTQLRGKGADEWPTGTRDDGGKKGGSVCGLGLDLVGIHSISLAARYRVAACSTTLRQGLEKIQAAQGPEEEETGEQEPEDHSAELLRRVLAGNRETDISRVKLSKMPAPTRSRGLPPAKARSGSGDGQT